MAPFILILYVLATIPVVCAADQRTCNNLFAFIISLLLTPVVGFLFVLCYDSKDLSSLNRRRNELLSAINDKIKDKD